MYDELVKRLINCVELHGECALCLYQGNGCDAMPETPLIQAADAIEELSKQFDNMNEANIALYGALPRWIPVAEQLPKYGERVLVFGGVTMYVAYYDKNRYAGESWHKLNSKSHYCNPTHWMPLPAPPKEE